MRLPKLPKSYLKGNQVFNGSGEQKLPGYLISVYKATKYNTKNIHSLVFTKILGNLVTFYSFLMNIMVRKLGYLLVTFWLPEVTIPYKQKNIMVKCKYMNKSCLLGHHWPCETDATVCGDYTR